MNKEKKYNREIEKLELELQVQDLKMKLQKAAELNHKMWLMLQDQTNHTEQLERITYGKRNDSQENI